MKLLLLIGIDSVLTFLIQSYSSNVSIKGGYTSVNSWAESKPSLTLLFLVFVSVYVDMANKIRKISQ